MTLLLGRISNSVIELGADGLSISTKLDNQPGRTTLQKLFQMNDRPIAVAQVGSNIVRRHGGDCSLAGVVTEFFKHIEANGLDSSVHEVAERLTDWLSSACTAGEYEYTLWVAGFVALAHTPEVYRITLTRVENMRREPRIQPVVGEFIADGSGERHVQWVPDLQATFDDACQRQQEAHEFSFGGHFHSLQIAPCGCDVLLPPLKGTLGFRDLLEPRDVSAISLEGAQPPKAIANEMDHVKEALKDRAVIGGCRRPTTILGALEHCEWGRIPRNRSKALKLVAMGDEANVADPSDVSSEDAILYVAHSRELTDSLPSPFWVGNPRRLQQG